MLNRLIKRLAGQQKSSSEAKKRLHFALVYDKLEVNEDILHNLQNDIVEVISTYFEIDRDALNLELQRKGDTSALVFNTPILQVKKGNP